MLYDSYHKKITKVLKTLRKIFKHIVLISIVTGVLLASLITFMVIKGMILDDKALASSFETSYGDELPLNSSAIFAKCSYEYSEDGETWSSEKPIAPGEYKARAMAKNIFGKLRYGMVYDFVINPKEIDVSVSETMIKYGDLPTVKAELAYEDKISCEAVTYRDKFVAETMVMPNEDSVKIENADGEDVTKHYKINIVETNITITPRPVTIIISGKEMIYNNTVLSNFDGYEVSEETPAAYDDKPIAVLTHNFRTEVGETPNEPSELKMVNSDGEDVSVHYQISKVVGVLKVSERPLYIKTATAEKAYDDTDLINKTCEVVNEYPIVDGHTLECTSHTSIKYVGEVKNTLVFTVKNEAGEDKTANYSLFYEEGTLKITPRPLHISSTGKSWVYDGVMHPTEEEAQAMTVIENACPNHKFLRSSPDIIDAGTLKNEITIKDVYDASGKSVISNYEIVYGDFGDLVVTPREITVTPTLDNNYNSKYYDGTAFMPTSHRRTNTVPNHNFNIVFKSVGPDAGKYKIELDEENTTITRDGVDATKNFVIRVEDVSYEIKQQELIVVPTSKTKSYDGTALTFAGEQTYTRNNYEDAFDDYNGAYGGLVSNHILTATFSGSQTEVGSCDNEITAVVVKDAEGNDVTKNYNIDYSQKGTLEVTKASLYLKAATDKKTYDGKAFDYKYNDPYIYTKEELIASGFKGAFTFRNGYLGDGYKVTAAINGDTLSTMPGTYSTQIIEDDITVTDANGRDITENYYIYCENGSLTINKRNIVLDAISKEKFYDGLAYEYSAFVEYSSKIENDIFAVNTQEGDALLGEDVVYAFLDYDINLLYGTENVRIDSGNVRVDIGGDGTPDSNWTDYYTITINPGTLKINPRKLTIKTESDSKVYDGTPLTNNGSELSPYNAETGYGVIQNDIATVYVTGSQTEVGSSPNHVRIIIKDKNENIIFEYNSKNVEGTYSVGAYEIEAETLGMLTVTPKKIKIALKPSHNGKITVTYDGKPIESGIDYDASDFVVVEGLPAGASLTNVQLKDLINADTYPVYSNWSDVDITLNGQDIAENYEIEFDKDDKIVIAKKTVYIETGTARKPYDGKPLTNSTYEYQSGLVDGHRLASVEITGSQTEVGESKNTIGEVVIVDRNDNNNDVSSNYEISSDYFGTLEVYKPVAAKVSTTGGSGWLYLKTKAYGNLQTDNNSGKTVFGPALENSKTPYQYSYTDSNGTKYNNISYLLWPAMKWNGTNKSSYILTVNNTTEEYMLPYYMGFGGNYTMPLYEDEDYTSLHDELNPIPSSYSVPYYRYSFEDDGIKNIWGETINVNYEDWVKDKYLNVDRTDTAELIYAFLEFRGVWNNYADSIIEEHFWWCDYDVIESLKSKPYYGLGSASDFIDTLEESDLGVTVSDIIKSEFDYNENGKYDDEELEELITAVAKYIRSAATYDMNYPKALDTSSDVAKDFLVEHRRGNATHFATAATMLYRALGIPARYVEGYIVNVQNEIDDVTDKHAWVEVFVSGKGWVYMEVTPGFGGKQAVQKLEITVKPKYNEKEYDGKELLPTDIELVFGELPEGYKFDTSSFKFSGGVTNVDIYKEVSNVDPKSVRILDANGHDVTHEFNIRTEMGDLTVTAKAINIALGTISKIYDGIKPQYSKENTNYWVMSSDFEYDLELEVIFNTADVFSCSVADLNQMLLQPSSDDPVSFRFNILNKNGGLIDSSNYRLQIVPFSIDESKLDPNSTAVVIEIKPIMITITAANKEAFYDEDEQTVLTDDGYTINSIVAGNLEIDPATNLPVGHSIEVEVTGSCTAVGTVPNVISSVVITDANGNDITKNYNITRVNGTLTLKDANAPAPTIKQ